MRRNSPQRDRLLLLSLLVGLVAPVGTALAQPTGTAATADAPAPAEQPPPIQPIPVDDVSVRAEETASLLVSLQPTAAPRDWLEKIEEQIDRDRTMVAERTALVAPALQTDPKVRNLEGLRRMLSGLREPLMAIDAKLGDALAQLSSARDRTQREADVWKATLDAARAAKASNATLQRIRATQQQIDETLAAQLARRNRILTLRDRLVDPRAQVDAQLNRVQAALAARLQGVFRVEREPVWSPKVRAALVREVREDWRGAVKGHADDLLDYVRAHPRGLVIQVGIFFVLALGLRALDSRVRRRPELSAELVGANAVFEQPTAMAFVAALALTWRIHPLAPTPFIELLGTLAIVPSVMIVRRLLPETTPVLAGIVSLFFADRFRGLLSALPTIERVVFDLELLGAIVFLIWLVRRRRLDGIPAEVLASRSFRIIGAAIRIAIVLLSVAELADFAGMGDLSDLIGSVTLASSYYAVFTFASLRVAQSVFAYLLLVRPLSLLRGVSRDRARLRGLAHRWMRIAAWAIYALVVLRLVGLRTPLFEAARSILAATLTVGALSISLGDVVVFVLTVYVSLKLARLVDFVLREDVFPRVALARGVPYAISNLVRYTFIFLGFMVALAAAGIELSKLTVIAGGLGVGIGFGLQNVVNNFVSGLILLFERPLQVGDAVQLGSGLWGEITRIGIRASVIRTFDGADVIVPNGSLISDQVTNWTLSDRRRRIEVPVGVEYGTDAQRVIDLLLGVAREHPEVLSDPEPLALFTGFGDSSLNFVLRAWIGTFNIGFTVGSDLAVAIQRALREAGIGVPFPQRDLHLRSVTPEAAAELRPAATSPREGAPGGAPGAAPGGDRER